MRSGALFLSLAGVVGLSSLAAPSLAAPEGSVQKKVRMMLNASGKTIDQCTERYLSEYPKADGKADITATVVKNGTVASAKVDTSLEGARNLRYCLERAAKTWKFPPHGGESEKMSLTVEVRKGLQFKILAPGEKPPARAGKKPSGFLRMVPTGWSLGAGSGQ